MGKRIEVLKGLNAKGMGLYRSINEPLTNTVELEEKWFLGFCCEQTLAGNRMILSVSRLDRRKFTKEQLLKELPELLDVFDINPTFYFEENFQNRGFTLCFRVF